MRACANRVSVVVGVEAYPTLPLNGQDDQENGSRRTPGSDQIPCVWTNIAEINAIRDRERLIDEA